MTEKRVLTPEQAYLAMYAFLDKQHTLGCEELGGLLGAMSLLEDGRPIDQAIVTDWAESVEAALSGQVDTRLILNR
ncbi:hypothetical protein KSF73_04900 [Burkholderiaceae bacterium DAT-1]|nr:hypothetical protein [Burkholderiaceae bacterium DAT-1]